MALHNCNTSNTPQRCYCCVPSSSTSNCLSHNHNQTGSLLENHAYVMKDSILNAALNELSMLSVAITEQPPAQRNIQEKRLRSYSFNTAQDSVLSRRKATPSAAINFHDPLSLDMNDSKDLSTVAAVQPPNSPVSPSAWLHAQSKSLLFPPNHYQSPLRPDLELNQTSDNVSGGMQVLHVNKDYVRPVSSYLPSSARGYREADPEFSDSLDRESHLQVLYSLPNLSSSLVIRPRRMRRKSGPCGSSSSTTLSSSMHSISSIGTRSPAKFWPYKIPRPRLRRDMERVRTRSETLVEVDESNLEASTSSGTSNHNPSAALFISSTAPDKENMMNINTAFDALTVSLAPPMESKSTAEMSITDNHFPRSKSLEELTLAGENSGLHAVVDSVSHKIEKLHVT